MIKVKKLLIIMICFISISYSQISNSEYMKEVIPSAIDYKKSKIIIGVGLISAGGLLLVDENINNWIQANPILPDNISMIGDRYISDYYFAGVSFAGALFKGYQNKNYIEPMRFMGISLATTGAITQIIKMGFNRKRPDGDEYSFPSLHTSGAFSTATILHKWYGKKIGIPAYTMAIITGLSRMNDNKHFASDVIFGATLGIAIPTAFYEAEKLTKNKLNISFSSERLFFEYKF